MTAALQSLGQGEADRRLWTAAEVAVGCGLLGKNKHQRHLPFPYNSKPFPKHGRGDRHTFLSAPCCTGATPLIPRILGGKDSFFSLSLPRHVENFPALFVCGLQPLFPRKEQKIRFPCRTPMLCRAWHACAPLSTWNSQVWRESSKKSQQTGKKVGPHPDVHFLPGRCLVSKCSWSPVSVLYCPVPCVCLQIPESAGPNKNRLQSRESFLLQSSMGSAVCKLS